MLSLHYFAHVYLIWKSSSICNCIFILYLYLNFSSEFYAFVIRIILSPLPRGDFAHAGVKFTEVSSYSGSVMISNSDDFRQI